MILQLIHNILLTFQPSMFPSVPNSHPAPLPPTRKESRKDPPGDQHSGSFEARFSSMFKTPQFLPPPEPFIASSKTYPSRTTQSTFNNNNDGRGISVVQKAPKKSRKTAPAPRI